MKEMDILLAVFRDSGYVALMTFIMSFASLVVCLEGVVQALLASPIEHRSKAEFDLS